MRRFLLSRTSTAAVQQRNMFVFSQQSKILQDNQKTLGSDSNVWLEEWEVSRSNIKIVKNALTTISLDKSLEVYNFNDLENPPDQLEMPVHTSFATMKPYGRKLQLELADRAVKKNFNSKFWIPVGQVRKQNYTLRQGARPTVVLTGGTVKLHHTSCLENGDALQRTPVSGGSRRQYAPTSRQFQVLSEAVALNNYATGLFYTKRQADALRLTPLPDAIPVSVDIPNDNNGGNAFFNLDQLELPKAALETLNRTEPDVPSFLLSGEPLRNPNNLKKYSSNFWLSARDAEMYQFNIKAGEKGISLSTRTNTLEMFHAEQMVDVEAAYRVAGHYIS